MEICIKNLNLTIDKKVILSDINMELEKGKIYGIVGRNGSGKTMLMKCICGFVKPTSGEIRVANKLVGKEIDFPQNMGILIENPGFISYYNGMKNLKLLAGINNIIKNEQIEEAMKLVGLDPMLRLHVGKYSLGMRQRLGIAQAIMENPNILILDEPMNGLDKEGVEDMRNLFLSLRDEGKTIIIASHNALDIEILCNQVFEMEKGYMMSL